MRGLYFLAGTFAATIARMRLLVLGIFDPDTHNTRAGRDRQP